jgi:hypothetical protein
MLGPRQVAILKILADGPCTLAALEHRAGAGREQLRHSLRRLVDGGVVTVSGKRGKRLDGVVVELSKTVLQLADGKGDNVTFPQGPKPKGLGRFLWPSPKRPNRPPHPEC